MTVDRAPRRLVKYAIAAPIAPPPQITMRVPELIAATCVSLGFRVPGRRSSKAAAFSLDVPFAAGVEILTSSPSVSARLARPANQRPLYPQKRTSPKRIGMSVKYQNATLPHLHLGREF